MSEEAYRYQQAVDNMNKAEERAIDEQQFFCVKILKDFFLEFFYLNKIKFLGKTSKIIRKNY